MTAGQRTHWKGLLLFLLLAGLLAGCKPTVAHLNRWENRPGSEELYSETLVREDVEHEVRVRALELLVVQWQYSSNMMRQGGPLNEIGDSATRARIIRDAMPAIRAHYDTSEVNQVRTRDAVFHIRQATSDPEALAALDSLLVNWLEENWAPCRQVGGVMTASLFNAIGRQAGEPMIVRMVAGGTVEEMLCTMQATEGVTWRNESTALASALTSRWDTGALPESDQGKVDFLGFLQPLATLENVRVWMFEKIQDPETPALYNNLLMTLISDNRTENDIPRYQALLQRDDVLRWVGFEALINMRNADGLEMALSGLPAEGDYALLQGRRLYDGFKRSADMICQTSRLAEIRDSVRPVLLAHINDENIHSRAIAIHCLAHHGDAAAVEQLRALRRTIDRRNDIQVPFWGQDANSIMLSQLLDETIAAAAAN